MFVIIQKTETFLGNNNRIVFFKFGQNVTFVGVLKFLLKFCSLQVKGQEQQVRFYDSFMDSAC